MTTAVLPFTPHRTRPSTSMWRWLLSGQRRGPWYYLLRKDPQEVVWATYRELVLDHYIKRHPGSRPWAWWRFSAPEPRQRLGGTGDPLDACTNLREQPYCWGVPWHWRQEGDHFKRGVPLSAADPPLFESEASYLRRLKLLLPGDSSAFAARTLIRSQSASWAI
jgi:hypothetical protein